MGQSLNNCINTYSSKKSQVGKNQFQFLERINFNFWAATPNLCKPHFSAILHGNILNGSKHVNPLKMYQKLQFKFVLSTKD